MLAIGDLVVLSPTWQYFHKSKIIGVVVEYNNKWYSHDYYHTSYYIRWSDGSCSWYNWKEIRRVKELCDEENINL